MNDGDRIRIPGLDDLEDDRLCIAVYLDPLALVGILDLQPAVLAAVKSDDQRSTLVRLDVCQHDLDALSRCLGRKAGSGQRDRESCE